jgi:hypothetical protein
MPLKVLGQFVARVGEEFALHASKYVLRFAGEDVLRTHRITRAVAPVDKHNALGFSQVLATEVAAGLHESEHVAFLVAMYVL